jgi:hypothetical protein
LYDAPIYFKTEPTTSLGESTIEILPASSGRHRSAQSCNNGYINRMCYTWSNSQ